MYCGCIFVFPTCSTNEVTFYGNRYAGHSPRVWSKLQYCNAFLSTIHKPYVVREWVSQFHHFCKASFHRGIDQLFHFQNAEHQSAIPSYHLVHSHVWHATSISPQLALPSHFNRVDRFSALLPNLQLWTTCQESATLSLRSTHSRFLVAVLKLSNPKNMMHLLSSQTPNTCLTTPQSFRLTSLIIPLAPQLLPLLSNFRKLTLGVRQYLLM